MIDLALDMAAFGVKTKILGKRSPLIASFKLTYRCNLRCPGCPFHSKAQEEDSHLSWQKVLEAMDRLEKMGCRIVIFEGGEPLLWRDNGRDFGDIAGEAAKRFIRTGVVTNGTLPLESKTDLLWISLDGPESIHNSLRDGSWDSIMANLTESKHRRIYAHCTINRTNLDHLEELVAGVAATGKIRGITFQFFYPYNRGEIELSLTQAERERAVQTILRLRSLTGRLIMNSPGTLRRMIGNDWRCREWLLANVHPDGNVTAGCYVRGRGELICKNCGFTPVAEASRAYTLIPGALAAGTRIFG